mgnify:FL=1
MVKRITKTTPVGGAKLKRPDGSTYMELPETPFDATKEGETRKIDETTGYFGKKIS